MENLHTHRVINTNDLFDSSFIHIRNLYLQSFNGLPSANYVSDIDGERAYQAFKQEFGELIGNTYRSGWYKRQKKCYEFNQTVVVLNNGCLVEFDNSSCEILHNGAIDAFVNEMTSWLNNYRERKKREPREINLVVQHRGSLGLRPMEIKRTKVNLDLFYPDDFKQVDETIRKRLNSKNDKGIVLLHGMPGTGKTTYLRHLIGKLRKRVLFVSSTLASDIMSPDFIQLLIDNPNSLLVIEDAEKVIVDRKQYSNSPVSNLLNISDGLMADCLNVQVLCTFNSSLTMVDSALMRKGRLIARYEFGKLEAGKAQRLSDHLGFDRIIDQPMTIAEITHPQELTEPAPQVEVIGFRRHQFLKN